MRQDTTSGRFYTVKGARYPSVTTILGAISKPALVAWSAKVEREMVVEAAADLHAEGVTEGVNGAMPRDAYADLLVKKLGTVKAHTKQLTKAGDIGSEVHHLIEAELRHRMGEPDAGDGDVSDEARRAYEAWLAWAESVHLKPLKVEQTVYSHTHQYAGTMDLLAELDGVVTLIDWKSGKAVYPEAFLQNAAYRMAVTEMDTMPAPEAGLVVRLPKTARGKVEPVPVPGELPALFETFLSAKTIWHWQYANEQARKAKVA